MRRPAWLACASVDPGAAHHHFAGASLGVTAADLPAGRRPGAAPGARGRRVRRRAWTSTGSPSCAPSDVRVRTSARPHGRARRGCRRPGGLELGGAPALPRRPIRPRAARAAQGRDLGHGDHPDQGVRRDDRRSDRRDRRAAGRRSGSSTSSSWSTRTRTTAPPRWRRAAGARVLQQDELLTEFGPALGKGDAMWRALARHRGDVVCFLDGDTADPRSAPPPGPARAAAHRPDCSSSRARSTGPCDAGGGSCPTRAAG